MVNPRPRRYDRRPLGRDLATCIINVALAANELQHCIEELWETRAENLKSQGLHNVQAVMDSIKADVLAICRDATYTDPMLAAIQGVVDGFRPAPQKAKVRSFPFDGHGGAA
jgi:hypothetical protein